MTSPAATRLLAHGRALAHAGRCPRCAERLGHREMYQGAPCRRCGAHLGQVALAEGEVGHTLRRRSLLHLVGLCAAVAAAHALVGWVPLLSSILLLAVAVWLRFGVLYPLTADLSPVRRRVARWTARLLVGALLAATLVGSELLLLFGPAGVAGKAALGAIQVGASAALVTSYVRWQVGREQRRRATAAWEWALLLGAATALATTVAGMALTLLAAGAAVEHLAGYLIR